MDTLETGPPAISTPPAATNANQIRFVFTLVHGTWARFWLLRLLAKLSGSALWYEEGSRFRAELKRLFPASIFLRSDWSGANSVNARMEAAKMLAVDLQQRVSAYPNANHFIIAHSHSGNIACYTFRDQPELKRQVTGLISLSTPFLHANVRDLRSLIARIGPRATGSGFDQKLVSKYVTSVMSGLYLAVLWPCLIFMIVRVLGVASTAQIYSAVGIFVISLVPAILFAATRPLTSTQNSLVLVPPQQLLIIRIAADEASALLLFCQVGMWLANTPLKALMLPLLLLRKLPAGYIFVLCLGLASFDVGIISTRYSIEFGFLTVITFTLVTCYDALKGNSDSKWIRLKLQFATSMEVQVMLYSLGPLVVLTLELTLRIPFEEASGTLRYILIISLALLTITLVITPLLTSLAVGFRYAFSFVFLNLAFETAPPGLHKIHQFGLRSDFKEQIRTSLNHSVAYESPEVIAAIADWIRNVAVTE